MTLKLKSITLDNLSQVTVAPSKSNETRKSGRRFTVAIGDESREVVLKDLFKRTQKLAKEASSAGELSEINDFIEKLTKAETDAAKIYNDRDDSVYKFKSWFRRFFGGAFLGSHIDRLNSLKAKVEGKQEELIESFRVVFEQNRPTFRSFVDKEFEIKVDDQIYVVKGEASPSDDITLKVQKKEDLGSDTGLLEIVLAPEDKCSLIYEGNAGVVPPQLAIIMSEISNEVDAREIKQQNFLKTLTLVRAIASDLKPDVNLTFSHEGKEYLISRSPLAINIQEIAHIGTNAGLLTIILAPEDSDPFEFEGEKVSSMPDSALPTYNALVMEAYKRSSNYSNRKRDLGFGISILPDKIEVLRDGIKHIPEWHLNELIKYLSGNELKVQFLADDLSLGAGIDAGGVKRDYIATLAASLQESNRLFAPAEGSLKLPRILRGSEVTDSILLCDTEEATTYENLGRLFYLCYDSSNSEERGVYVRDLIVTGNFFSEALFKAALSLKNSDDFDDEPKAYIEIAKELLDHMDKERTPYINNCKEYLDLDTDSLKDFLEANNAGALYGAVLLADEDYYTDEDGNPDIDKIKIDPEKFIEDLRAGIFKDTNLVKKLNGVSLGAILDPVYQVSLGMRRAVGPESWFEFSSKNPVEVSNQIQGSIDKKKIVDAIKCDSLYFAVKKKAGWMKDWIENEATDEEIKAFLRFVTGSASLPEGKNIDVKIQAIPTPFPTVCTCGLGISVSSKVSYGAWKKDLWDDSKEHFIRNLKQAMVVEGFQVD